MEQAIQVSPIAEETNDMGKVREVFDRALNAIVDATDLSRKLTKLQADFEQLRREVETVRDHNRFLDEALHITRKQRDDAQAELATVKASLSQREMEVEDHRRTIAGHETTTVNLRVEIEDVRKARDDAEFRALDLEDRNKELQRQLDAIKGVLGVTPPPTVAETKPEPASNVAEWPHTVNW